MDKRWIAHKLKIKDLVSAEHTEEGFLNYRGIQVNRVRLLGTVVSKFASENKTHAFIVLDDGTETVRVKCFEDSFNLVANLAIGEVVDVFGKIKINENEIYVVPEIIKKISDSNLELLRKAELLLQDKKNCQQETSQSKNSVENVSGVTDEFEMVIEEKIDLTCSVESPRKKIIELLVSMDKGEGVEISKLVHESKLEESVVETVLTELMNDGDLFEPRSGKVKLLS